MRNLVIEGVLVLAVGAALMLYLRTRRGGNVGAISEVAERLGLAYERAGLGGQDNAFGQLSDGRTVRMLDEQAQKRFRVMNPWSWLVKRSLVLEVGVESDAWEQLSSDQRGDGRLFMAGHCTEAKDRHLTELNELGFPNVSLVGQSVRVRATNPQTTPEQLQSLVALLGRIAAETERGTIRQVLDQASDQPPAVHGPAESTSVIAPDAPGESTQNAKPWNCPACQARNPAELSRCQMCSASRTRTAKAAAP